MSSLLPLTGVVLQHWTDHFVALRRAPAPEPAPALAGTAAVAALLRVASLAELLLIGLLYFKGTPGTSGAFYTGLALWVLLVVAPAVQPLWHWLGFIHDEPSSKVCHSPVLHRSIRISHRSTDSMLSNASSGRVHAHLLRSNQAMTPVSKLHAPPWAEQLTAAYSPSAARDSSRSSVSRWTCGHP